MRAYSTIKQVSHATQVRIGHFMESVEEELRDASAPRDWVMPEDWTVAYKAVLDGILVSVAGSWLPDWHPSGDPKHGVTITRFSFGCLINDDRDPFKLYYSPATRDWLEVEVQPSSPKDTPFKVRFTAGSLDLTRIPPEDPIGYLGMEKLRKYILGLGNITWSVIDYQTQWRHSDEAKSLHYILQQTRLAFIAPLINSPDSSIVARAMTPEDMRWTSGIEDQVREAHDNRLGELRLSSDDLPDLAQDLS